MNVEQLQFSKEFVHKIFPEYAYMMISFVLFHHHVNANRVFLNPFFGGLYKQKQPRSIRYAAGA
ncbi:hypothetical protein DERF_003953 [Dermatophagoides farinae]|uniref:Uncharacterized protein n=1 Tax=Dermatophagoides farinae TaxID=6954 RepID=A0A922LBX3_DERFA|nr:hypothetical protein DERF_003953 [Dermatophagoides farinae]